MHIFSMDTSSLGSNFRSNDKPEVILATSRPKKRAGRKKFKETRHPVYRGVRKRNSNKWVCELREPNKPSRIWLGTYPTAEMAARAHDVAALALKGELACLNFEDSIWRLPVPVSKDAKDIKRAAVEAAEAFRPREYNIDGVSSSSDRRKLQVNVSCIDDEEAANFDMRGLLVDMAEGPLLSPPPCLGGGFSWDDDDDHAGSSDSEVTLWSYSI